MKATMAILAAMAAFGATATTTWKWTGAGGDMKWSNTNNWDRLTAPASNDVDTIVQLEKGGAYVNDLPSPYFKEIWFVNADCTISGNPLHATAVSDATSEKGHTWTVDVPFYACGRGLHNRVTTKAGNRIVWNKLVTHEWDDEDCSSTNTAVAGACGYVGPHIASGVHLYFSGAGTNVFNGPYRAVGRNAYDTYQDRQEHFHSGTFIFNNSFDAYWTLFADGAHMIFGPGSVYRNVSAYNDWTQDCTVDIYGSYSCRLTCIAQAYSTSRFNVRDGGFLYGSNFRMANNKETDLNVYPGGTMVWDSDYGIANTGGKGVVNLYGGRFLRGRSGTSEFKVGSGALNKDLKNPTNYVNFAGGEMCASYLYNNTGASTARNVEINLDGGRFKFGADRTGSNGFVAFAAESEHRPRTKVLLHEGGFEVDTQSFTDRWNVPVALADGVSSPGALTKLGTGTLRVADDMNAFASVGVVGGTFHVEQAAYWTKAVALAQGTALSFDGTSLALAGLSAANGVVKLAAGQSLSLPAAPTVAEGKYLVFDVPSATDGELALVALTGDAQFPDGFAAKCKLLTPTTGKSCTFAVSADGKTLSATVADGDAPEAFTDLAQAGDGWTHYSDSAAVSTLTGDEKLQFDAKTTLTYGGAAAGTLGETRVSGNPITFARASGAGDLTVNGPLLPACANGVATGSVYFKNAADDSGKVSFAGDRIALSAGMGLDLVNGKFEFAGDCVMSFVDSSLYVRSEGTPNETVIAADAHLALSGLMLSRNASGALPSKADGHVKVTQTGGGVDLTGTMALGYNEQYAGAEYVLDGGAFAQLPSHWARLMFGTNAIVVNGGAMALGRLSFGNDADYGKSMKIGDYYYGPYATVKVDGGELDVQGSLSWVSDGNDDHHVVFSVGENGKATLPASVNLRSDVGAKLMGFATLALDGGEVALSGDAAFGAGKATDYFSGLGEIVLGAKGGTLSPAADAVVSNVVRSATESASLVKSGAADLTLAGGNEIAGALSVRQGKLTAKLASSTTTRYPDGLVILWDFDGDEPLKDKTGNGFDLVQMHPDAGRDVVFNAGRANRGNAATWSGKKESMKVDRDKRTSAYFRTWTMNCWVKLGTREYLASHHGFISHRVTYDYSGNSGAFELCFKTGQIYMPDGKTDVSPGFDISGLNYACLGEKAIAVALGMDTNKESYVIQPGDWHMITLTTGPDGSKSYFDGTNVVCNSNLSHSVPLLGTGNLLTVGEGIKGSEFCAKDDQLDDVAFFSRVLTQEEITQMYADTQKPVAVPTPDVAVAYGATWDMAESSATTRKLSGAGTIANGTVTLDGSLAPDTCAAAPLAVANLALASAPTVDFARSADPLPLGVKIPLFAYGAFSDESAAFLRQATLANTGFARKPHATIEVDAANRLATVEFNYGTVIIVR